MMFLIGLIFGLIVGWFFFPRPAFMVELMDGLKTRYPGISPYVKRRAPTTVATPTDTTTITTPTRVDATSTKVETTEVTPPRDLDERPRIDRY